MYLEFTDDQDELRENVRTVLAGDCPPSLVRAVFEGTGTAEKLWDRMVELYWPGLAVPEGDGGIGLTFVEVGLVCEELGRAVAPAPFLATVTQFAALVQEAGPAGARARFLGPVLEEGRTGTLAFAEDGRWTLDAVATTARPDGDAWVLDGAKTAVFDGAGAAEVAVVARTPGTSGADGIGLFVVPGSAVDATPRTVIDPTQPIADLRLDGVRVEADRVLAQPGDPAAVTALERAVEQATAAVALSTIGACRRIFEETVEYSKVRVQYDRPIGSFQALKHRMANMYLAVEKATALCYFAALTIAEDDPRRAEAVSMAKAAAGDCQRLLVEDGLQLHGGIGFTWEHDLHFLLKRAKSGGSLFGTSLDHRARLAKMAGLDAGLEVVA